MIEYSVLIIDDDPWMQRILSKTLQSYGFKKVLLASDGFEGISLAVGDHPHLIILDIMMPELSGHMTLKLLKEIKLTKDIPVLMVSALSDTENLGKAVQIGTAGFISKPFTRNTVFEKLVSIYGNYNLGLIQNGEKIDYYKDLPEESKPAVETNVVNDPFMSADLKIAPESKNVSSAAAAEPDDPQIRVSYQMDEERNLDAIKKLLLKRK